MKSSKTTAETRGAFTSFYLSSAFYTAWGNFPLSLIVPSHFKISQQLSSSICSGQR